MSVEKFYIGVDIGKNGGFALQGNGKFALHKMPLKNGEVDFDKVFKMLNYFKPNNCHVCFEKLQGIFGTSKKSTWSLAEQVGVMKGLLISLRLPFTEVNAKVWQKEMFAGIEKKLRVGKGGKDKTEFVNDTKEIAYWSFIHHYPKIGVPKGPRGRILDGQIDAALILRYAMRMKLK